MGWWLPESRVSATVRVDNIVGGSSGSVSIGVLTDQHPQWARNSCSSRNLSPHAWYYASYGHISREKGYVPRLRRGSVVKVTLNDRRVTFTDVTVDGDHRHVHTFTLPERCGNVTLGVVLS